MSDQSPKNKNSISNCNLKHDDDEASSLSLHLKQSTKENKKSSSDKKDLKKIIAKEQKKMDKILRKKKKEDKKKLKKLKKEKKKIKKILKKKQKLEDKLKKKEVIISNIVPECDIDIPDFNVIKNEDKNISRLKAPMTKEEWEAQQRVIKRVFDPETGRHRLVKGTGEILEECVSRERHKEINKIATKGDGLFYQSTIISKIKRA